MCFFSKTFDPLGQNSTVTAFSPEAATKTALKKQPSGSRRLFLIRTSSKSREAMEALNAATEDDDEEDKEEEKEDEEEEEEGSDADAEEVAVDEDGA